VPPLATRRNSAEVLRFEVWKRHNLISIAEEGRRADTRIHTTTKCQVTAIFVAEKPLLLPQLVEPSPLMLLARS
jgi:hypothetical protein